METTLPPSSGTTVDRPDGIDEIIDLTDRRRVLLHLVFGVTVPPPVVDHVFDAAEAPVTPR
jgi:hypothetical protein